MTAFGKGRLAIVWDERVQQSSSFSNSIGFQVRDTAGKPVSTTRLTPDTVTAVYPVITPIDETNLLVAYTRRNEQTGEVWCQLVSVKQ